MKNWIITASTAVFMLMFTIAGTAQHVPQKVKDAFTGKYASATNVEWDDQDDDDDGTKYEVDFTMNGEQLEASFVADGTWKYTQKDITRDALPQALKSVLQNKYPDLKIDDIDMLETPDGPRYTVEVDDSSGDRTLLFSEDGTKLKEITEKEDDDGWFD